MLKDNKTSPKQQVLFFYQQTENTDNNSNFSHLINFFKSNIPQKNNLINKNSIYNKYVWEKEFPNRDESIFNNYEFQNFDNYQNAKDLFSEVRDFTKKEAAEYGELLNKLYKPTGENFFEL